MTIVRKRKRKKRRKNECINGNDNEFNDNGNDNEFNDNENEKQWMQKRNDNKFNDNENGHERIIKACYTDELDTMGRTLRR